MDRSRGGLSTSEGDATGDEFTGVMDTVNNPGDESGLSGDSSGTFSGEMLIS